MTVKLNEPGTVGVPKIAPVDELIDKPLGRPLKYCVGPGLPESVARMKRGPSLRFFRPPGCHGFLGSRQPLLFWRYLSYLAANDADFDELFLEQLVDIHRFLVRWNGPGSLGTQKKSRNRLPPYVTGRGG